jgi:hypothetical protein
MVHILQRSYFRVKKRDGAMSLPSQGANVDVERQEC